MANDFINMYKRDIKRGLGPGMVTVGLVVEDPWIGTSKIDCKVLSATARRNRCTWANCTGFNHM